MPLYCVLRFVVQAFLRQGQALQSLKYYEQAMIAFAQGLMNEPANMVLLNALKDVTLLLPLKGMP